MITNLRGDPYERAHVASNTFYDWMIDPTQRTARSGGCLPDNILTSTFSDELSVHFAG